VVPTTSNTTSLIAIRPPADTFLDAEPTPALINFDLVIMMRRAALPIAALATLTFVAACGRKGARSADFDSATATALALGVPTGPGANVPHQPHIESFELARQLDRLNHVYGGPVQQFQPGDSILLSIRTIYVDSGSTVSARLRQNKRSIDSTGARTGALDSLGMNTVGLRFAQAKPFAKGDYQVDVFLNGTFQVSKDFSIVP
jgi:hypothetical protein